MAAVQEKSRTHSKPAVGGVRMLRNLYRPQTKAVYQ